MTFSDALAAFRQDGDAARLESAFQTEAAELRTIATNFESEGRDALSGLDGTTPQEREQAFLARNAALTEARTELDAADVRATQLRDAARTLSQPARVRKAEPAMATLSREQLVNAAVPHDSIVMNAADIVCADAGFQDAIRSGDGRFRVMLNATTVTEPMPHYPVADPQMPRQGFLDRIMVVVEPGGRIVYYVIAEPGNISQGGTAAPASDAATRARNAAIQSRDLRLTGSAARSTASRCTRPWIGTT